MDRFSEALHPKIKWYVYALTDPRDDTIIYVGKGYGNRIFQHTKEAFKGKATVNTEKSRLIKEIIDSNHNVIPMIIRWNLDEKQAFIIESILIDLLSSPLFEGKTKLSNLVSGHDAAFNLQSPEDIESQLTTGDLDISTLTDKILVITVTENLAGEELYERVRGNWNMSKDRASRADYVLAAKDGVVIGVYKPITWQEVEADANKKDLARNWLRFTGVQITDKDILNKYLHKQLPSKPKGAANPIRYYY